MKSLVEIVKEFTESKESNASKAVFEAAMEKHVASNGLKVADLCWNIYECEVAILKLASWIGEIEGDLKKKCGQTTTSKKK